MHNKLKLQFTLSAICLVSVSCFDFLGSALKDKVPLKPSFSVVMDEFIHEATRLPKENFQDLLVSFRYNIILLEYKKP